ncbi:MAG: S41 family peptidase, partial [Eubacteriales bacterium]|nr:S41 family peptidase [Eubacteriales bacterium]
MLDGAKRGLLAGLRDPYTFYYSPDEFAEMWEDDEGEYAGIGIQISASYETYLCTIIRVFSDSPAYEAGLKKGDILYKVEDLDVDATTLNDAVDMMRGEVGTTVHVQVMRDGELLDFDIPRAVVHVNWVSSCMLSNEVGYIQLYEFAGDCADTFQKQLNALVDGGVKALIIDLRDNPGGWIDSAVDIADIFLPEETVTYLEYRSGEREYYNATDGALQIPLVVMLNENSASASEILSGALQDYGLATIVGTQSYGKGCVQFVLPLGNNDGGMQLTAALYYTPNGRSIHQVGITPDVEATLPDSGTVYYEFGDMNDPQLQKAFEVATEKLAGTFATPTPSATPASHAEQEADTAADADSPDTLQSESLSAFRVS